MILQHLLDVFLVADHDDLVVENFDLHVADAGEGVAPTSGIARRTFRAPAERRRHPAAAEHRPSGWKSMETNWPMYRFLCGELPAALAALSRLIVRLSVSGSAFETGTTASSRAGRAANIDALAADSSHDWAVRSAQTL